MQCRIFLVTAGLKRRRRPYSGPVLFGHNLIQINKFHLKLWTIFVVWWITNILLISDSKNILQSGVWRREDWIYNMWVTVQKAFNIVLEDYKRLQKTTKDYKRLWKTIKSLEMRVLLSLITWFWSKIFRRVKLIRICNIMITKANMGNFKFGLVCQPERLKLNLFPYLPLTKTTRRHQTVLFEVKNHIQIFKWICQISDFCE